MPKSHLLGKPKVPNNELVFAEDRGWNVSVLPRVKWYPLPKLEDRLGPVVSESNTYYVADIDGILTMVSKKTNTVIGGNAHRVKSVKQRKSLK